VRKIYLFNYNTSKNIVIVSHYNGCFSFCCMRGFKNGGIGEWLSTEGKDKEKRAEDMMQKSGGES